MPYIIFLLLSYFCLQAANATASCDLTKPHISVGEKSCVKLLRNALTKSTFPKNRLKDCPQTQQIILWRKYLTPKSGATFQEIMSFMDQNPHWPRQSLLRQRAEEAITSRTSPKEILTWFQKYPPLTGIGAEAYAGALLEAQNISSAKKIIQDAWHQKGFTQSQLKAFYRKFKKHLTPTDHLKRFEWLGWDSNTFGLHGMRPYLPRAYQQLCQALISLIKKRGDVDTQVTRVSKELQSYPLLVFHRIKWRLQKGKMDAAYALFQEAINANAVATNPQRWAPLRQRFARHFINQQDFQSAYDVLQGHGLTSGVDLANTEWLLGWLSLRRLGQPKTASQHLEQFYQTAETPMSKAKAAYWLGFAQEQLHAKEGAQKWYARAAAHPMTFFGQLALENVPGLKEGTVLPLIEALKPCPASQAPDHMSWCDTVHILKILKSAKLSAYAKPFLITLARAIETDSDREHLVHLASLFAPQFAVLTAKIAGRKNSMTLKAAYPTLAPHHIPKKLKDTSQIPLINAIIRQESGFNEKDMSPAGALGLMQLMPKTAKLVAKSQNIRLRRTDLLCQRPSLNVQLGVSHVTKLLHTFEGDIVLTLASYNAGHGRVLQWIKRYGDPRAEDVDLLDWIEMIPFEETRIYVYRILETLPIYEALANKGSTQ